MAGTYNPTIRNNETWDLSLTLTRSDSTPFPLTGYTGKGQIKSPDGETVLAALTVSVTNADQGVLRVFLPLAQAETLEPTPTVAPPRYHLPIWDVILSNADQSHVFTVIKGEVTIQAGVTHWT